MSQKTFNRNSSAVFIYNVYTQEEFEDTKGVIRIRKSKDRQHIMTTTKGQTMTYKTLNNKFTTYMKNTITRNQ